LPLRRMFGIWMLRRRYFQEGAASPKRQNQTVITAFFKIVDPLIVLQSARYVARLQTQRDQENSSFRLPFSLFYTPLNFRIDVPLLRDCSLRQAYDDGIRLCDGLLDRGFPQHPREDILFV